MQQSLQFYPCNLQPKLSIPSFFTLTWGEKLCWEIPVPIRHQSLCGKCEMHVLSASERSEGKEGEIGSEALAGTEISQTPQPGIEPGTPANAVDALPLSHRDKRHHQPVCLTILSALPPLHNKGIIHCPQPNPLRSGEGEGCHGRHCAPRTT